VKESAYHARRYTTGRAAFAACQKGPRCLFRERGDTQVASQVGTDVCNRNGRGRGLAENKRNAPVYSLASHARRKDVPSSRPAHPPRVDYGSAARGTGARMSADAAAGRGIAPVETLAYQTPRNSGTPLVRHTPVERRLRERLKGYRQ
jgi:hypothetical protein